MSNPESDSKPLVRRQAFTTDHIVDIKNDNLDRFSVALRLQHYVKLLWTILKDVNECLYQQDTKTILLNKPIFDQEKRVLVTLDTVLNNFFSKGLIFRRESGKMEIAASLRTLHLNSDTTFAMWNDPAKEANFQIQALITAIRDDDFVFNVRKGRRPQRKKRTELPCLSILCRCMCVMFFVFIIIAGETETFTYY